MEPQFIRTPTGEELVVLARADYEALLADSAEAGEDAADAALYLARKADLDAGLDQVLPPPVSAALLRGERLLRALRRWRGVTQKELASRTGLAQGYLSEIEVGAKVGSGDALGRIASALDVPAEWILTSRTAP